MAVINMGENSYPGMRVHALFAGQGTGQANPDAIGPSQATFIYQSGQLIGFPGKYAGSILGPSPTGFSFSITSFTIQNGAIFSWQSNTPVVGSLWDLQNNGVTSAALFMLGEDFITGSTHEDYLEGYSGHDVLSGRGGVDILDGGSDTDYFVSNVNDLANYTLDYIADFQDGVDLILLQNWGLTPFAMFQIGSDTYITHVNTVYSGGIIVLNATVAQVQDQVGVI